MLIVIGVPRIVAGVQVVDVNVWQSITLFSIFDKSKTKKVENDNYCATCGRLARCTYMCRIFRRGDEVECCANLGSAVFLLVLCSRVSTVLLRPRPEYRTMLATMTKFSTPSSHCSTTHPQSRRQPAASIPAPVASAVVCRPCSGTCHRRHWHRLRRRQRRHRRGQTPTRSQRYTISSTGRRLRC